MRKRWRKGWETADFFRVPDGLMSGSRRGAVLFAADDVVHLKAEVGVILMDQAVFTESGRPLDDEPTQTY